MKRFVNKFWLIFYFPRKSSWIIKIFLNQINLYLSYQLEYQSLKEDSLKLIAGTLMASMSQTYVYLPKVTHHLPTKMVTVLLNENQIDAIQHPAKWKILTAPFGGGKTVVLSEIAKNLLKVLLIKCYCPFLFSFFITRFYIYIYKEPLSWGWGRSSLIFYGM